MPTTAQIGERDLALVMDLDPAMREVSGARLFQEAAARRLQCPTGGLLDDPLYGYDLLDVVHDDLTAIQLAQVQSLAAREVEKDERCLTCVAYVQPSPDGELRMVLEGDYADGPFSLTLAVSAVSAAILQPR